jgi:hypothetical protein
VLPGRKFFFPALHIISSLWTELRHCWNIWFLSEQNRGRVSKVARVTCTGSEWYELILRRDLHRVFFLWATFWDLWVLKHYFGLWFVTCDLLWSWRDIEQHSPQYVCITWLHVFVINLFLYMGF